MATGTHTPNHRRSRSRVPELSCGLTAGTPSRCPPLLAESPFLTVTLTLLTCLGLSPQPRKLFSPFPRAHSQVSSAALPEPQTRGSLLLFLLQDSSLTQFPAFGCPSAAQRSPSRKGIKTTRTPVPPSPAQTASKEAGRKQPPGLPIPRPVSQAAGRAASCQPGKRAAALPPSPSPETRRRGARGLPCWGGGRRERRQGVLRAGGSAVHRPAGRCAGSSSEAACHY